MLAQLAHTSSQEGQTLWVTVLLCEKTDALSQAYRLHMMHRHRRTNRGSPIGQHCIKAWQVLSCALY